MRGYYGIGVIHPKVGANIGTIWRSAQAFGAAFVFTVGRRYERQPTDASQAIRHVPLFHFLTVDALVEGLPRGCPLVGVETGGTVDLPDYKHRERACYLLGAEDHGLSRADLARCHDVVTIPGAAFCLNVASAATVVMYDRVVRGVVSRESDERPR